MDANIINEKIRLIENTKFTQIPGPNPILTPGKKGSWDDGMLEVCNVLKDNGKYYLYYHGTGDGNSYRIGVAVSDSPLGPFVKYGDKPILDLDSFGGEDDRYIACGTVIKEKENQYYLFYSLQQKKDQTNFYIGLATADNPLGPWKKHENNPIMKNFGYVGGVTKKDGKYYMFNEYPTHYKASDYGPISMAVADKPEGPWTPIKGSYVMDVGDWGTWDDAGYSEAGVKYDGTMFHMFYGGGKVDPQRLLTRESIGYAYSVDGKNFTKYSRNPVAHREAIPYGAAMAEVCYIDEYPYIYLYHTLRYTEPWLEEEKEKFPSMEHIGVQVLCVADHFSVEYPVFSLDTIAPGETAYDKAKLPLSVMNVKSFALTVSCTYSENATAPLVIHGIVGKNEKTFDTEDSCTFELALRPGQTVRQTFTGEVCARFMQFKVENTDTANSVSDISLDIVVKN